MDSLMIIVDEVKKGYIDEKPAHISAPDKSVFKILTQEEYDATSIRQVQEILRRQHIVIVNRPKPPINFDANGLRTLTRLTEAVPIQGVFVLFNLDLTAHKTAPRSIHRH
jgi:hypothetical protein